MIKDVGGTEIKIVSRPNAHCLLLGQSGSGKTIGLNILAKNALQEGHRVLILDYSDSFTEREMKKAGVLSPENVLFYDLAQEDLILPFLSGNKEDDVESLTAALSESFEIIGRRQKLVLRELISNIWDKDSIRFSAILDYLELMCVIEKDDNTDKIQRIEEVLEKLTPLAENDFIKLVDMNRHSSEPSNSLTILEFSGFSFEVRKKLANLCLELYWKKIRSREAGMETVRIVLDEIQNVGFRKTQAFTNMIREGRKYDLGIYMATQFVNDTEKLELLMQAANILFFKPTLNKIRKMASLIEDNRSKMWMAVLEKLTVGQFILLGSYTVNKNTQIHQTPILGNMEIFDYDERSLYGK